MNEQYAQMITRFPLFQGFTTDGARMLLDRGDVRDYATGEVVINEGAAATFVLLVLTGKMEVFIQRGDQALVLAESGPGTLIGELAVLCGIPRSASVRASGPAVVLQWSAAAFRSLLLGNVFLSERIFRESLRIVIEKERALIESLIEAQSGRG